MQRNSNITLSVDKTLCVHCNRCVAVCPNSILYVEEGEIEVRGESSCISCGHCVAICPAMAIKHTDFPPHKVHKIDGELIPTPQQLIELIQARRSNRAFSAQPVDKDSLSMIAKAASLAPTATNIQLNEFTIITNPDDIKFISEFTINQFSKVKRLLTSQPLQFILKPFLKDTYAQVPMFNKIKDCYDRGDDKILRGATAVMLISTKKPYRYAVEDTNLAYQNASLMAESLGVAHFYMGFVMAAIKLEKHRAIERHFNIDGNIYAAIAMGVPQFKFKKYINRKDIDVTFK